eukprot:1426923-Pyramimonas_sp.AAC.1
MQPRGDAQSAVSHREKYTDNTHEFFTWQSMVTGADLHPLSAHDTEYAVQTVCTCDVFHSNFNKIAWFATLRSSPPKFFTRHKNVVFNPWKTPYTIVNRNGDRP